MVRTERMAAPTLQWYVFHRSLPEDYPILFSSSVLESFKRLVSNPEFSIFLAGGANCPAITLEKPHTLIVFRTLRALP